MRYGVTAILVVLATASYGQAPAETPAPEVIAAEDAAPKTAGDQGAISPDEDAVREALDEAMAQLRPGPDTVVLDLLRAQQRALEDNPNLGAAQQRVEQAIARVKQARSQYFPLVTASYQATHTHLAAQTVEDAKRLLNLNVLSSATSGLSSLAFLQNSSPVSLLARTVPSIYFSARSRNLFDEAVNNYTASLQAQYTVFDGFARMFSVAAAKYGRQELEEAYREAQRMLLQAVAQSYYGVQLARENMAIAEADIAFQERLLKDARARRRVGTGSLSDVLNFEVRLRAAQTALLAARQEYEAARVALASLMGMPEGILPDGMAVSDLSAETPDEMIQQESEGLVAYALENRPDVLLSEHTVSRTDATVKQRRGVYYPRVDVFATRDASSMDNGRFDTDDFSSTVGVQVSYDLFTGGRNRAAVSEAKSQRREATYLSEDAAINATAEVRDALIGLRTAQQQLVLQRTTAEYVEKNRDLVEKEYEVGQGALARLNQAQRDLTEAQARLATARVSLRLAWHTLRTATGQTLEPFAS
jgi:outer membrane protein TolC